MVSQRPRKLQWIVWGISLILCVNAGRTILDLLKRQDIVNIRQSELKQLKGKNKALEQSLSDMASSPYIEQIARDQLGLVRAGETVVIIGESQASESGLNRESGEPIWKQWYNMFF